MCPKWFLSLWYIRTKPSTYLGSRLALSPIRPSFHLTLVTSKYHQVRPKRFLSRWYVWRKPCAYLPQTLTWSPNGKKRDSTWPMSPKSSIVCIQNDFRAYGTSSAKPCTYLALTLILSPNGKKTDSTWPTSPRSFIGCIQNDFQAYGMFDANRALILCQD
jgi:hypothetical protein